MAPSRLFSRTPEQALQHTNIALLGLFISTLLLPRGIISPSSLPLEFSDSITTNPVLRIIYVVYLILGSVLVTVGWIVALCITTEQIIGGSRSQKIQSILQCIGIVALLCFGGFVFFSAKDASASVEGYVELLMWPLALYGLSFAVRSGVGSCRTENIKEKVDNDVEKGKGKEREDRPDRSFP